MVSSVKTTLERIKTSMHNSVDVPDISQEGLLSGITSFKALKALYYPLMTRCNEKLMVWKPALESLIRMVIEVSLFYESNIIQLYEHVHKNGVIYERFYFRKLFYNDLVNYCNRISFCGNIISFVEKNKSNNGFMYAFNRYRIIQCERSCETAMVL